MSTFVCSTRCLFAAAVAMTLAMGNAQAADCGSDGAGFVALLI